MLLLSLFTTLHKHTNFNTLVLLFIFVTCISVHVWRHLLLFTPKLCQLCTHLLSPSLSEQFILSLPFVTLNSFLYAEELTFLQRVGIGCLLLPSLLFHRCFLLFFFFLRNEQICVARCHVFLEPAKCLCHFLGVIWFRAQLKGTTFLCLQMSTSFGCVNVPNQDNFS